MELVNIRELKNRARAEPGEYRVHAQVEAVTPKKTRSGSPFYEIRIGDAEDHVVLKAWSDSPEFSQADQLPERSFVEVTAAWEDTGKYGIDGKNWQTRALKDAEVDELLRGGEGLLKKQAEDFSYIEKSCGSLADPRLRALCADIFTYHGAYVIPDPRCCSQSDALAYIGSYAATDPGIYTQPDCDTYALPYIGSYAVTDRRAYVHTDYVAYCSPYCPSDAVFNTGSYV